MLLVLFPYLTFKTLNFIYFTPHIPFMSTEKISEGKANCYIYTASKISKELPVFYNPVMKFNRDTSVLLLKCFERKFSICDPLAGTGIRGIRFLLELKNVEVDMNDISEESVKLIKKNLKLNKIKNLKIGNKDANVFLLESKGYDYIDIDPFGFPGNFLDAAVKRLGREGILAVTATDTSALSGTFPKACLRKYWALPKRDAIMHETGLRILIRKVQLIGVSHNKALTPIFSYSKDHYMRVFFLCEKSKKASDEIIKQHGMFNDSGPMWLGKLWNNEIVEKMYDNADVELKKFMKLIKEESKIEQLGFYHIHDICKKEGKIVPNYEILFKKIKAKKYQVSRTHFDEVGIRSDVPYKELVRLLS